MMKSNHKWFIVLLAVLFPPVVIALRMGGSSLIDALSALLVFIGMGLGVKILNTIAYAALSVFAFENFNMGPDENFTIKKWFSNMDIDDSDNNGLKDLLDFFHIVATILSVCLGEWAAINYLLTTPMEIWLAGLMTFAGSLLGIWILYYIAEIMTHWWWDDPWKKGEALDETEPVSI